MALMRTPGLKRSQKWEFLSLAWRKAHPNCVVCGRRGDVVDHIRARRHGGALYDPRNLQTMCHKCHNRKTGYEKRGKTWHPIDPVTGLRK